MDVQETTIRQLLEGSKQYVVPLHQRPYGWGSQQRGRLWGDVLAVAESRRANPSSTHFMGSLVLSSGRIGPTGVEFLIVDGQQRLITLSILLCALRDHLRDHRQDDPMLSASIHEQYVADRYKSGDTRLKVLPTPADRESFRRVVDDRVTEERGSDGVRTAYLAFRAALESEDDPADPHRVERIRDAVLGGLVFVSITAKGDDDVYRIFESLNNTGLQLTQGDLIRNHVFMRLGSRGESVYASWWLPMQDRLCTDDLELLFWLDAVPEHPALRRSEIHAFHQARLAAWTEAEIVAEVVRFSRLSELLAVIRDPATEPHDRVRRHLEHLAEWGSTTTLPITLRLLARRAAGRSNSDEIAGALAAIESLLVRRTLSGRSGDGVHRRLLQACGDLEAAEGRPDDLVVLDSLSSGRKHFATDATITSAVMREPYYLRGRRPQQKLVLAWIERSLRPNEPVDAAVATIEHVLPQRLTPAWRAAIVADTGQDESVDQVHERLVHTLGNLTITGYNAELGNRPFAEKRIELATSGFRMNQRIAAEPTWGPTQITARGAWLAERICAIWVPPSSAPAGVVRGVRWDVVHQAIAAIPVGRWTSFGDLAALIGTHPVPLGQHLANVSIAGAHRVLHAEGTIPPASRWSTPDGRDVRRVLEDEGIAFSAVSGRASQAQRLSTTALASLTEGTGPPGTSG